MKYDEDYSSNFFNQYNRPEVCDKCGNSMLDYKGLGEYKCIKCSNIMFDDYGRVRRYLEENPGATVAETSEAVNVPQKQITIMLKEERLEITKSSRSFLRCESCGAPITSGRFCDTCKQIRNAVAARRKHDEELEKKKSTIQGTGFDVKGDVGKRRFDRD
ncbi:MAG: MerR family transcriptional regulator [Lachnospiraceae bacterium]|nr:MerR family transcriptional regulator [Lachnospiraceae bacterium]